MLNSGNFWNLKLYRRKEMFYNNSTTQNTFRVSKHNDLKDDCIFLIVFFRQTKQESSNGRHG
jgi:hypothetical protein